MITATYSATVLLIVLKLLGIIEDWFTVITPLLAMYVAVTIIVIQRFRGVHGGKERKLSQYVRGKRKT